MSQSDSARVHQLLGRAQQLNAGEEAIAIAEEAIRLADVAEDHQLGFEARNTLMEIASAAGAPEKLLLAFAWCLATADRSPDDNAHDSLLWKYKWCIEHLVGFPRIPLTRIEAALEDFKARCLKLGYNERAPLFLRWTTAMFTGHFGQAKAVQSEWNQLRRDGMADCAACECNRVVELHAAMGEDENAILAAEPILRGRSRCAEIPHLTHATLLEPYWRLGRHTEAMTSHTAGLRLVRRSADFVRELGWHQLHLVRYREIEQALAVFRKHLSWALKTSALNYRFHFFLGGAAVLRLLVDNGHKSIRFSVPPGAYPPLDRRSVETTALLQWMESQLRDLAAQFDARNGNNYFSSLIMRGTQTQTVFQ